MFDPNSRRGEGPAAVSPLDLNCLRLTWKFRRFIENFFLGFGFAFTAIFFATKLLKSLFQANY